MNTMPIQDFIEILPLFAPIVVIQLGLMIFCLIKVAKQTKFRFFNKLIWILIIMFIQLFGPIAYLILEKGDN